MACKSCGEKKAPKDNCSFTKAVVEINNPETLTLLRKVVVPASLGDDETYPPKVGKYKNVILYYEANDQVYLYSSDGIPTRITIDVSALKALIEKEKADRIAADEVLQQEIEDLKNAPDVVDIVDTYADLQAYDTSKLGDKDIVRVLDDETHNHESSYYRWNKASSTWTFIGSINYIYTAGAGLNLNGHEFSVDTTAIQEKLTAGSNIQINDNVISATDTTYTAGTGLDLNGAEFSVDTTVIAEKTDIPTVNNATLTITQNGTSAGTFTANSATDATIALTDTTYSNYTGATSLADGTAGLVPAPLAGDETKFLSGNGQWTTVSQYSLPIASANDLGGIKVGNNLTIDSVTGVLDATDTTYSNFVGTDGQTAGTAGLVPAPATTDAGKFLKADGTWDSAGGASFEPTILTSADYNYPADNPTWLALWLLPTGYYRVGQDGLKVRVHTNMLIGGMYSGTAFYIDASPSLNTQIIVIDDMSGNMNPVGYSCLVNKSNGVAYTKNNKYADGLNLTCYDGLNLADSKTPLSAKQGKVLNDKIEGRVITGAGAPTTSTVGTIGKLYEDTTNGKLYICTDTTGGVYTWEEVGGSAGPTVVQTTGQSTTDVMSQKAVTDALAEKQDTLTFDTTPTASSTNPVTSDGIKGYVDTTISTALSDYTPTSSFATVALTGNYGDLINTPATLTTEELNNLWEVA